VAACRSLPKQAFRSKYLSRQAEGQAVKLRVEQDLDLAQTLSLELPSLFQTWEPAGKTARRRGEINNEKSPKNSPLFYGTN
jgi:hypothetical protein